MLGLGPGGMGWVGARGAGGGGWGGALTMCLLMCPKKGLLVLARGGQLSIWFWGPRRCRSRKGGAEGDRGGTRLGDDERWREGSFTSEKAPSLGPFTPLIVTT